ncbi:MAG: c-type cytochrome biogenesis protein CcmI [Alphaproteobacteria bacterium]|nr:c-type cytochrome biogenesis protein CcmI [Alphaproteobacteria bacterium]
MMLWLGIAVLSAVVIALVLWPMRQDASAAAASTEFGLRVYRDQLAEIERDLDAGLISADQAAAARLEVERRMLTVATDQDGPPKKPINPAGARISAGATAFALPAIGFLIYLTIGAPDKPDQPLAARDPGAGPSVVETAEIRAMVERLAARLETQPDDVDGWMMLGRSYRVLGRMADSAEAYRRGADQSQGDSTAVGAYAEALVYAADGAVTPAARVAFEDVLRRSPADPRARYFVALARVQAGEVAEGLQLWRALEADSPPDAPWLSTLQERIADAARLLNLDPAKLPPVARTAPAVPPPPPRGPSQADVDAASRMAPQDRTAMIRSMVEGLEQRLQDNPDDLDGWKRLARSWEVLGELDKARAAQERIAALEARAATSPAPSSAVASTPPRGPSQADVEAANRMAPQDRTAMIRGMVEGLEQRLKDNPNDLEGWRRLARSWGVLGERDRAQAALAQAVALAPDRVDVLIDYARALFPDDGDAGKAPPAFVATMRRIHALDPDHAEALYHVGLAEAASGNKAAARRLWTALLAKTPAGSPGYVEVKSRLDSLDR